MKAAVFHLCFVATVAWAGAARLGAALSVEERAIVDWLAPRREEMTALLEQAVKIDSPSENIAGVRAMGARFATELEALGLTARWVDLPVESGRAGHLFAERKGARGKRVLMIGHLDTVLPGGKFVRNGDTARGSGVNDIKGGDVVLIYALKALQANGALADTQIIVAMTGDEESIGSPLELSRRSLLEVGKRSDVALAFEGGIPGEATVARRGSRTWQLEITAVTGHSSGVFSAALGSGAIYEAARILEGFHVELRKLPGLTANAGLMAGGAEASEDGFALNARGKTNIIPAKAIVKGDLRAVSPEQVKEAEAVMRGVVAQNRPRAQPVVTFEHRYPPMAADARHLGVLALYDAASRDLGLGAVVANDPAKRGAGDCAFVAPYCAVLDGLGPYGSGAHAERETVELNSLVAQATRTAVLLYRLTR